MPQPFAPHAGKEPGAKHHRRDRTDTVVQGVREPAEALTACSYRRRIMTSSSWNSVWLLCTSGKSRFTRWATSSVITRRRRS
ncbi:hypothetical protein CU044_2551 [Streptomyces sp. L-9-10]|nr:hypothetical protein CU044_2551 [Streptomyces sp. L-9-10]